MPDDRGRVRRREGEHVLDVVRPGSRPPGVPTSPTLPAVASPDQATDVRDAIDRAVTAVADPGATTVTVDPLPFGNGVAVTVRTRLSPARLERLLALLADVES